MVLCLRLSSPRQWLRILSDFSPQKIRQIIFLPVTSVNSSDHRERARVKIIMGQMNSLTYPHSKAGTISLETVSQSFFVIASDRRERGNLFISNAL